jgi:hypothetical protein
LKQNAFVNTSSSFFPISSQYNGLYAYSLPYKQIVNDTSISGANIMSGVYYNGTFLTPGTGNFYGINHYEGTVYFTQPIVNPSQSLSGVFAYKEFGVKVTDKTDYKLLFDGKYIPNQKYASNPTGIEEDVEVFPIIYLRPTLTENRPFALAGLDDNTVMVRAVIIAEDMYKVMGASNILKDLRLKTLPIYSSLPFDQLGLYTGAAYNFEQLPQYLTNNPIIWKAKTVTVSSRGDDFNLLDKKTAFVDFEIRLLATHP